MSDDSINRKMSSYLEYLPAIFQQDVDDKGVGFISRFLLAFEEILSGLPNSEEFGLEQIIDRISTYFNPGVDESDASRTPASFLPWLASWMAFRLRKDWDEEEKRRLISRIALVYRRRGTKEGLKEILSAYTDMPQQSIEISEFSRHFKIGVSAIGVDTALGLGPPHYFLVKMFLDSEDADECYRKEQHARAIIDLEKPAHTYYDLKMVIPTLRIGVHSTVGVDTFFGTPITEINEEI